ncbi:MAG: glycosyltransferase family 32 protein [Gammaproteobacteria bacterium]
MTSTTEIPKKITQIWGGGKEIPLLGRASAANVRLLNPEFEYTLFDDGKIDDFVATQFPEYRQIFEKFRFSIQRYDFLRYLLIYRFGGFYFDLDVFLALGLSDLTGYGCIFPFERLTWSTVLRNEYRMDWEIGNYAFGASAGHPFLEAIIKNCVRAQEDLEWRNKILRSFPSVLRDELFVIYTTGPGLVSRTYAEYPELASQVKILFPRDVCDKEKCWNLFGNHGVHLGGGMWRTQHGFFRSRLINALGRWNERQAIEYSRRHAGNRPVRCN